MDVGIVTAKIDEVGYITHAENLGYSHAWVTDSPMIRSNCWAVLALAAAQTRTIRLGTGARRRPGTFTPVPSRIVRVWAAASARTAQQFDRIIGLSVTHAWL